MITESELVAKVVAFLKDNGYPSDSILLEYAIPNHGGHAVCRADIAIVVPGQLRPLALFEVKRSFASKDLYESAYQQLYSYVVRLRSPIRAYLVFAARNKVGFSIYDVTNGKKDEIDIEDGSQISNLPQIVSFDNLVRGNIAERHNSEIENKEDRYDDLVIKRWVGICMSLGLFVRDYYINEWKLSWECLAVLCAALILWLLPYFDVISFKDFTLQRHLDKANN